MIHKCDRCGREFTTSKKLLIHLRWSDFYKKCAPEHVAPPLGPPYFCRYCKRPFDTLAGLYKHQSWTVLLGHCYIPAKLYIPTWLPVWTNRPYQFP